MKRKYLFTKAIAFVKEKHKAIIFIFLIAVCYKLYGLGLFYLNLKLMDDYGIIRGGVYIFLYTTLLSVSTLIAYKFFKKKIEHFFKLFLNVEIPEQKSSKSVLFVNLGLFALFTKFPAIFVISFQVFKNRVMDWSLFSLFVLSNITVAMFSVLITLFFQKYKTLFLLLIVLAVLTVFIREVKKIK